MLGLFACASELKLMKFGKLVKVFIALFDVLLSVESLVNLLLK